MFNVIVSSSCAVKVESLQELRSRLRSAIQHISFFFLWECEKMKINEMCNILNSVFFPEDHEAENQSFKTTEDICYMCLIEWHNQYDRLFMRVNITIPVLMVEIAMDYITRGEY